MLTGYDLPYSKQVVLKWSVIYHSISVHYWYSLGVFNPPETNAVVRKGGGEGGSGSEKSRGVGGTCSEKGYQLWSDRHGAVAVAP